MFDEFLGLHEGTLKVIGQTPVQGVIQFPSFHTAMAILYTYAARGVPVLFPLLIVFNVLMIVSTMPIGGHYFADVLGGAAIALVTIGVVRCIMRNVAPPEPLTNS